ncbi:MAG: hypothetical protein LAO79_10180 [Acidobacteriia bacterium]|nr:hypothetical protein [Terriglobia bacterium]
MNRRSATLFLLAATAFAHVGSPDIFLEGSAGPYPVFVTIRPPMVIPGVAEIEIRCSSPEVSQIRVTPTPLTGAGAKFAPTPDLMQRSNLDPQFFTGSLWMMAPGSWQVRVEADGAKGSGQLSVPVPAVATQTKPMQTAMAAILLVMTLVLALGVVSIVGASVREGSLAGGEPATGRSRNRARILMGATAALVVFILWAGDRWWIAEASSYSANLYKPLGMTAAIEPGDKLVLTIENSKWLRRRNDDFLPDHGHLMHLYVIAEPDANRAWHLHPDLSGSTFVENLPPMPAGRYKLYGDVVHADGLAETMVAELNLPHDLAGTALRGDDAAGVRGESPDGAHIEWVRDASPIKSRQASIFKFRLVDKNGKPVEDEELYMGMLGHAAFVKNDGSVFAHVHPSGSVPMAALALANPSQAEHMHMQPGLPPEADFPYGFPSPGNYRVIVQMKHAGIVETGIFDTVVE